MNALTYKYPGESHVVVDPVGLVSSDTLMTPAGPRVYTRRTARVVALSV